MHVEHDEMLSGMYHCTLELANEDLAADPMNLPGHNATVTIRREPLERLINGIVHQCLSVGHRAGHLTCKIELVPAIFVLTRRKNSRIFQEMTTPQILADVMKKALEKFKRKVDISALSLAWWHFVDEDGARVPSRRGSAVTNGMDPHNGSPFAGTCTQQTLECFLLQTGFDVSAKLVTVESRLPHQSQVFGSILGADGASILAILDIKAPVEIVLDAFLAANVPCNRTNLRAGQRRNEEPCLVLLFAVAYLARTFDKEDGLHALPTTERLGFFWSREHD